MPSTSPKQARLMAACSHGAGYDSCPPAKVAKEFNQADKGGTMLSNKYAKGGDVRPANYAAGGPVLGKDSAFLKTDNEFTEASNAKSSDEDWGKGSGPDKLASRTGSKTETPVKPRK